MQEIKIRHSFEAYHRNRYGYYPTWHEVEGAYFAKNTQEKWSDWQSFFLSLSNEVLEGSSPYAMSDLYLKAESCQERVQIKCQNVTEPVEGTPLLRGVSGLKL